MYGLFHRALNLPISAQQMLRVCYIHVHAKATDEKKHQMEISCLNQTMITTHWKLSLILQNISDNNMRTTMT